MIEIVPETPAQHADAIEALYDRTFGPGHFAKTAERLREGNASLPDLTRVAVQDGRVIGVCRIWPIFVGAARVPAVFVGPVAVDPDFQGQRLGLTITGEALEAATKAGWGAAVIIGSPRYFGELGFVGVAPDRFRFPGPQDMHRVMVRALAGDPDQLAGPLRAI
ncbi:MAG: N-acetyltransferase [Hyphomonadaceae bacterium]|nr:N-acetyltransferase [Hyphomonadaceae bacterium]